MFSKIIYCIVNNKDAFVCKGSKINRYLSKQDIDKIVLYRNPNKLRLHLADKDYWYKIGIDPGTLRIVKCELGLNILDDVD